MDFAFSEEQNMLREQARSFLTNKFSAERVAELADSDSYFDDAAWKEIAELGWLGLSVSEDKGGAGFGFLEEAVLFEEFGSALYPGPYFSTVALAFPALQESADAIGRIIAGEGNATFAAAEPSDPNFENLDSLGTKAEKQNGSWKLSGEKILVPDLSTATEIVVVARSSDGLGLFLVKTTDASVQESSTMDSTRRLGKLTLSDTQAELLVGSDRAEEVLRSIRLRSLAAASLEAVGIAQRVLDLSVEHTKERKQFDKPIGTYQAVSHQVANTYIDTELARSVAYWAAWAVAEDDHQAPVAVAAAKSIAGTAAVQACERSIQVHGGIGFTWEHTLHRYYKRAQWIESFSGFGTAHRAQIAASLLDE